MVVIVNAFNVTTGVISIAVAVATAGVVIMLLILFLLLLLPFRVGIRVASMSYVLFIDTPAIFITIDVVVDVGLAIVTFAALRVAARRVALVICSAGCSCYRFCCCAFIAVAKIMLTLMSVLVPVGIDVLRFGYGRAIRRNYYC